MEKDNKSLSAEETETIKDFCKNDRYLEIVERNKNDEKIVNRVKEQHNDFCLWDTKKQFTEKLQLKFEYK